MSSLTIEDAESSFLKGKAEFDEWFEQFENRFYAPQVMDLLGTMINTMPAASRMIAPKETAFMEQLYRNRRGG
jgi:hypothetical protein